MPAPRETAYDPRYVWVLLRFPNDASSGEFVGVHATTSSAHTRAEVESGEDLDWEESGASWIGSLKPDREYCEWRMSRCLVYGIPAQAKDGW